MEKSQILLRRYSMQDERADHWINILATEAYVNFPYPKFTELHVYYNHVQITLKWRASLKLRAWQALSPKPSTLELFGHDCNAHITL